MTPTPEPDVCAEIDVNNWRHPDWRRRYNLKWRNDNRLFYRERDRKYRVKRRIQLRLQVIEHYGGKCVKCGFSDIRALHLDHINGGGSIERKKLKGKIADYNFWIIKNNFPNYLQLLCANCNWIKKVEKNETRHV